MSVRAGGVIKQVKNSPRYFGKYKTIETIDCHSCFTQFHMLTSKIDVSIEGALMSMTLLLVSSDQRSVTSGCNSNTRSAVRDL